MDRAAKRLRLAAYTLAGAAVPLLLAGCTASPGGAEADNVPSSPPPSTPEPVRFSDLPQPCSLLPKEIVRKVVPEADPVGGEALSSNDTARSAACLWNGLDRYQFRSLTVSLRRFESDVAIGSGDERAKDYALQQVDEISSDDAHTDFAAEQLADLGDEATSLSYQAALEGEDDKQDYRQQRVVVRTGNVVVTVDYAGTGFEDTEMPAKAEIKEAAETATKEAVTAVDATTSPQHHASTG